jgi:hypothetical protein
MLIREYGIEHRFAAGANIIEFTPTRAGRVPFSCWMGMIRSTITVVPENWEPAPSQTADNGSGLEAFAPVSAGVAIDADDIALAAVNREEMYQDVSTVLTDEGMTPSVLVAERGVPVRWTITNLSADAGNSALLVPFYRARLELERGVNAAAFVPTEDFVFSTADSVIFGYVKVVDALDAADTDAIRLEALEVETLIYPEAYFDE